MEQSWCTSCCSSCFISTQNIPISNSPFALPNLLRVGTIIITLPVATEQTICAHTHVEDGWHAFRPHLVIPHLPDDSEDIATCHGLEYLMKHQFISATCRSNASGLMAVRLYLIPYDLSNVQGKLRRRKDNILGPARRYMRALLPNVSQNIGSWRGLAPTSDENNLLPSNQDSRTLSDIYSDLASPRVAPIAGYGEIASRLLDFEDELDGFGMRSTLYKYQRRSVASMLQKELDLRDVPDPLYIAAKTIDNKAFYIQPGTMEILQECPMTASCRGGILCEELGTGKTVMMLSLIVATKNQLSKPEPSLIDDRSVMTPGAYRYFPSDEFAIARKRAGARYALSLPGRARVPTLVELMMHRARTEPFCDIPENDWSIRYSRNCVKEDEVNTLPLGTVLRANVPFYHHYLGEPNNRERVQRNKPPQAPREVYLTSTTLVVVPANLLSQWDREVTKHCAVPLRVLTLRSKTPMPNVQSLATDYDIILMTYTRFSMEANNQDIMKLHNQSPCKCIDFPNYRIPNCNCKAPGVSPFLQIRWKRLIIDEGHVSSTLSNILVPFAKLLSVERRWIVTGTPTTNLLGLSLGNKSVEEGLEQNEMQDGANIDESDSSTPDAESMSLFSSGNLPSPPASPHIQHFPLTLKTRIWTKYDREDLNKLGNMISHFISVPQFSAEPKLIGTHVVEPLLDSHGPRPGAIQVLNQVMEMVMIRHRIEDVEQDVVLPPVVQESVLLDLDPYVVKSFNALQAIIAINAIDSERKDQDYMFHPRNAGLLQETMKNMSQLLFWHVDENLYNTADLLKVTEGHIQRAMARNTLEEDLDLMQEAFRHLRLAFEDPIWKDIQGHEDVPYRIYDLNEPIFQSWTRIPNKEPHKDPRYTGLVHADMLLKLHDLVLKRPLSKQDDIAAMGKIVLERDRALRRIYEESQRKRGKSRKKVKGGDESVIFSASQMVENAVRKSTATETLREMQKELDATLARLEQEEAEENGSTQVPNPSRLQASTEKRPSNLIASSPLAKMRIGSSASTKLNYIINEIQKYSATDKFLIFSESPLTLAHISEALELKHVKFLRFTTQVTPQFREQLVLTFETSEKYRVFLMELKHGARGLNLISASRIIFCEPVWQADVESQAIKRAHRIGQTRSISVKTLAIRQTAEENMVTRRIALKNSLEKLPKVIEEAGMRHYIANPKFITHEPDSTAIEEFPLVDLPPELLQPRPGAIMLKIPALHRSPTSNKRVRVVDPIDDDGDSHTTQVDVSEKTPKKKKTSRTVSFNVP